MHTSITQYSNAKVVVCLEYQDYIIQDLTQPPNSTTGELKVLYDISRWMRMTQNNASKCLNDWSRQNFGSHVREQVLCGNLHQFSPAFVDKLSHVMILCFNMTKFALRHVSFLGINSGLRILQQFEGDRLENSEFVNKLFHVGTLSSCIAYPNCFGFSGAQSDVSRLSRFRSNTSLSFTQGEKSASSGSHSVLIVCMR